MKLGCDTHMTSTLRRGVGGGGGQEGKNEMLLDAGVWEVSECSECPIFIFLLKEIDFNHDQASCL